MARVLCWLAEPSDVAVSDTWSSNGSLSRRQYSSCEEYVSHQKAKLAKVAGRVRRRFDAEAMNFDKRFALVPELLPGTAVLCLGARLGQEVKAFRERGHFAVGIDSNPGTENPYVVAGDFHAIPFPLKSADVVYTNALDHTFDLAALVQEIERVLKDDGLFIADIIVGSGYTPGAYEAMHWKRASDLAKTMETPKLKLISERDLTQVGGAELAPVRLPQD